MISEWNPRECFDYHDCHDKEISCQVIIFQKSVHQKQPKLLNEWPEMRSALLFSI